MFEPIHLPHHARTVTQASARPPLSAVSRILIHLFDDLAERRRVRRDRRLLMSMPDHMLGDIGVTRAEVESMARGRPLR
jgi:uncharacterized protein YjiS (DUF1127 family)